MTQSGDAIALSSLETGLGISSVCDDSAESAALPATASVGGMPTTERVASADMRAAENRRNEILNNVKQEWNSQLNANFDRKCASETHTPMSASERGCAASHLLLWHMASRLPAEAPPAADNTTNTAAAEAATEAAPANTTDRHRAPAGTSERQRSASRGQKAPTAPKARYYTPKKASALCKTHNKQVAIVSNYINARKSVTRSWITEMF